MAGLVSGLMIVTASAAGLTQLDAPKVSSQQYTAQPIIHAEQVKEPFSYGYRRQPSLGSILVSRPGDSAYYIADPRRRYTSKIHAPSDEQAAKWVLINW